MHTCPFAAVCPCRRPDLPRKVQHSLPHRHRAAMTTAAVGVTTMIGVTETEGDQTIAIVDVAATMIVIGKGCSL